MARRKQRQPRLVAASRWRRLIVEQFEPRALLATTPLTSPSVPVVVGDVAYFTAYDGVHGGELWKSDGLTATLVKDITPGAAGSNPHDLANYHGTLYFHVWNGTKDALWTSDGTAGGTVPVGGDNDGIPYDHGLSGNINGYSFFGGWDATHGRELWTSNQATGETTLLKDINPGPADSNPNQYTYDSNPFVFLNGIALFSANDGMHGYELWKTDGTAAGTVMLKDTNPNGDGNPWGFQVINGKLFFQANGQLWASDGTAAGTVQLNGINYQFPFNSAVMNNRLYVGDGGKLWVSDGTLAGTTVVKDVAAGKVTSVGGRLMFFVDDLNGPVYFPYETALWTSDGTTGGTAPVTFVLTAADGWSWVGTAMGFNGRMLFTLSKTYVTGHDPPGAIPMLYGTDGTAAGTMLLPAIAPNNAPFGNDAFVTAREDITRAFTAADFGFSDPNDTPPNGLLNVIVTSLPASGMLALAGAPITAASLPLAVQAANIGQLTYTPAPNKNDANQSTPSFTFKVQDNGGTASGGIDTSLTPNTSTITVLPINDPPSGADKTVTTREDTPYIFTAADFGFSDSNDSPPNNFAGVRITTLPVSGVLLDQGMFVLSGQLISRADIDAGFMQYLPPSNANGLAYARFRFQVTDDGGTANGGVDVDPTPNTMTVNVTSVNDAPRGADNTRLLVENTSYTFSASDWGFFDPSDSPADLFVAVEIATLPSSGMLRLNGTAVTAGQLIVVSNLNAGGLVYTPPANVTGTTSFIFQVKDSGGTANGGLDTDPVPKTLSLRIIQTEPIITGTSGVVSALEDVAYTSSASNFGFVSTANPPTNLLAVKITTLPAVGALTDNGAALTPGAFVPVQDINAGKLRFTAPANANGMPPTSFTFQVQDDGDPNDGFVHIDPTPKTLTINVTSVNDPPLGTSGSITTYASFIIRSYTFGTGDFGFSDPFDTPPNALQNVIITGQNIFAGQMTLNGMVLSAPMVIPAAMINAGQLVYFSPASVPANADAFTFKVQDNGGTANGGMDTDLNNRTMTINVIAGPNHEPSGVDHTVNALEDVAYTLALSDFPFNDGEQGSGVNTQQLDSVKITTLPGVGSLTDNGMPVTPGQFITRSDILAGRLQFRGALNANASPYATFTFQVKDNGGTVVVGGIQGVDLDQTPNTQTINVLPLNDAPIGSHSLIATLEDTSYQFSAGEFHFSDPNDAAPANPAGPNNFLAVRITSLPASGSLTFAGNPVNAGDFILVNLISGLLFTPAMNKNDGNNPRPTFTFQVQDDGGTAGLGVDLDPIARRMTVSVTGVNDFPNGSNRTVNMLENGLSHPNSYVFTINDFGFSDPNDSPMNSLVAIRITTLPTAAQGTLKLSGVPVSAGQLIAASLITGGQLMFTPAVNLNNATSPLPTFTFQAKDDGGTANSGVDLEPAANAHTITVNVIPVNDPPNGFDHTLTVQEGTPYVFPIPDFPFTDPNDNPANTLIAVKITTLPSAGVLTDNGVAVAAGQFIPVADLASGSLRYTPPQSFFASDSFTFQVQDNGGTINGGVDLDPSPNTITLNLPEPPPPPEGFDATVTTLEDQPYAFSYFDIFGPIRDPIPNQPFYPLIAVKITTLPAVGMLLDKGVPVTAGQFISVDDFLPLGNATAGAVIFVPPADANGSPLTTFTFQIQDSGGTANGRLDVDPTPNTITINVAAVNDSPTFTAGPDLSATDESGPQTILAWAKNIVPGPADEVNQHVHFVIVGMNSNLALFAPAQQPSIDAAGDLTFTPAKNAHGTATITIELKDDGGTANGGVDTSPPQTFQIHIAKAHPLHNAVNPYDVNGDGKISPSDPLLVINFINGFGSQPVSPAAVGPPYYDVDGDNFIAPHDALAIINFINARSMNGEGEAAANVPADLLMLVALDVASQPRRRP